MRQNQGELPEIENKSPEMKNTAFRRRLQSPRVNKTIAMANRPEAAIKHAILGADRSGEKKILNFSSTIQSTYMQQL